MLIEIKHRVSAAVLFSIETESWRLAVEAAVKGGAYLRGADLGGAYLGGADGQQLTLIGERPFLQVGPLGSRADYLLAFLTDAGVYVRAGCFWDRLDAFKAAAAATHGDAIHGREYQAAIALIEAHAQLWTPAKAESEAA